MARTSRRQFAKTLTILPLAACRSAAAEPPLSYQSGGSAAALRKPSDELADIVRARYGAHLGDDDLERIATSLQDQAALLERLRDVRLANSDEPDVTFSSLTKRW